MAIILASFCVDFSESLFDLRGRFAESRLCRLICFFTEVGCGFGTASMLTSGFFLFSELY